MSLQEALQAAIPCWQPTAPAVEARSKYDVTMSWEQPELVFLAGELLYRVERKEKIPPWVVVYSGGKTRKIIENLAPCNPHKFRLRVIVKATAVQELATRAIAYYGDEDIAREKLERLLKHGDVIRTHSTETDKQEGDTNISSTMDEGGDKEINASLSDTRIKQSNKENKKWLESQWSEEVFTSTESEGTSATCFCMAVRGGYLKQAQIMLDERPALLDIVNPTTGYAPLATAVRQGDMNMVKYLLAAGAEVDQQSTTRQTPLQLAVLGGHIALIDLLLEKGADFQARDINSLRVEHLAVDSGDLATLRHVLDRAGDVTVTDNNGWTPLFRAVCQGANTAIVLELVRRGSDIDVVDRAGLSLAAAARTLNNRHGRPRESILRLVDSQYPHDKAVANFTKLTKKISSVHSLLRV